MVIWLLAASALAVCRSCPERAACAAWADGQPRGALGGVVGGVVRRWDRYVRPIGWKAS